MATTRARLKPCSPPGRPQPRYRSSISCGSSAGTLSSAVRMMVAARSSGRRSVREPLTARPMGDLAVATMTASGMPSVLDHSGRLGYCRVQSVSPDTVPVGRRMQPVVTERTGVGTEHRPGPFGEVHRYPAGLPYRLGLRAGDLATEQPDELAQRRRERPYRAQVRTRPHDYRDPRVAQSPDRPA